MILETLSLPEAFRAGKMWLVVHLSVKLCSIGKSEPPSCDGFRWAVSAGAAMAIKYPVRARAFRFRLAGIFFFATLVAIGLAAGREFGYAAVACFAAAPWPIVVYLRTVRFFMDYMDVSSHSRSVLTNLVLTLGLLFAVFGTLMLLAAGVESLRI